jgi:hypothetical protein
MNGSKWNEIHDNVFMDISNNVGDDNLYHVIYGGGPDCHDNSIHHNFVYRTMGDPFKFSGGAHHNYLRSNYVVSSGDLCYVQNYKSAPGWAHHIVVDDNTFVLPHADAIGLPLEVGQCHSPNGVEPCPPDAFVDQNNSSLVDGTGGVLEGNNWVYGGNPTSMRVAGIVSGAFDSSPGSDVVKALSLPTNLVVADMTAGDLQVHSRHLYTSRAWEVAAFTAGSFVVGGQEQVITVFRGAGDRIYRGSPPSTSIAERRLYTGDGLPWKVVAITAGDYDDNVNTVDQLVVAFESSSGTTKICRGSGSTLGGFDPTAAAPSCGSSATQIYSSTAWKVNAMTSGSFFEDGLDHVAVGFKSGVTTRVYLMDAMTGALPRLLYDAGANETITAMTSGLFDGTNHQLITAFRSAAGMTSVYRGDGTTLSTAAPGGARNLGPLYSSSSWSVTHLWGDELRASAGEEVITVFQAPAAAPTQIQTWLGDGTSGLTSYYKLLEWPAPP